MGAQFCWSEIELFVGSFAAIRICFCRVQELDYVGLSERELHSAGILFLFVFSSGAASFTLFIHLIGTAVIAIEF